MMYWQNKMKKEKQFIQGIKSCFHHICLHVLFWGYIKLFCIQTFLKRDKEFQLSFSLKLNLNALGMHGSCDFLICCKLKQSWLHCLGEIIIVSESLQETILPLYTYAPFQKSIAIFHFCMSFKSVLRHFLVITVFL